MFNLSFMRKHYFMAAIIGMVASASNSAAMAGVDEKALFDTHCGICHAMRPPATAAPPVLGIALHYHDAFRSRDEAVNHMVAFMQHPDPERSKLEPAAVKRFGLMPKMEIGTDDLRRLAGWLWDQYDPQFVSPGTCK